MPGEEGASCETVRQERGNLKRCSSAVAQRDLSQKMQLSAKIGPQQQTGHCGSHPM